MTAHYQEGLADPADTTSAWVSVKELTDLIRDNKNANGIRIYYGRYPLLSGEYPGQHNVILVSTYDFKNPDKPTAENSNDLLNHNPSEGEVNSVSYTSGYAGMGADTIPLCPPRCPATETKVLTY